MDEKFNRRYCSFCNSLSALKFLKFGRVVDNLNM